MKHMVLYLLVFYCVQMPRFFQELCWNGDLSQIVQVTRDLHGLAVSFGESQISGQCFSDRRHPGRVRRSEMASIIDDPGENARHRYKIHRACFQVSGVNLQAKLILQVWLEST